MTAAAPRLEIVVQRRDGAVRCRVQQPAPVVAAAAFCGRRLDEALRLVPLVYNLCPAAQDAALRIAAGLPLPPESAQRMARDCLRDHLVNLCLTLPRALSLPPDTEALRLLDAAAALRTRLALGDGVPASLSDLVAWSQVGASVVGLVFKRLLTDWDSRWGAVALPALPLQPVPPRIDWARAEYEGAAAETSAATRWATHPLLRAVETARGRGPVWRLAGRLVEIGELLGKGEPLAPPMAPCAPAPGCGLAPASRGAMLIEIERQGECLTAFRRLSPTDWSLHPQGLLAQAYGSLPSDPAAPLAELANALLWTLDPCLEASVTVQEIGHA